MGGLGPAATVDFMAALVEHTEAATDQEHIRVLVDHNPTVPNRHEAIAGRTPSVGPELAQMARTLERAGADFLVMVCNTAHAFQADIEAAINIPFLSIIDVTIEGLASYAPGTPVGVMAADGCLQAGLYQTGLSQAGFKPVEWTDRESERFMELVYRIKAGDTGTEVREGVAQLARCQVERGAQALIAGCTEIPLVLSAQQSPAPLLSSTEMLVLRTITLAREGLSDPGSAR